jgi:hypothetical protein
MDLKTSSLYCIKEHGDTVQFGVDESGEEHMTNEMFGKLQSVREYDIKKKERLFRKPKLRQYYLNGVLHRSKEEFRTSSMELFADLIYVGAFGKAGDY